MKQYSLFWKIYSILLLVLALPIIFFGLAEMLASNLEQRTREPKGLKKILEWNLRNLAEEADALTPGELPLWLRETEQASGLDLYLEQTGEEGAEPPPEWLDAKPPLPRRAPYPPYVPIVASVFSDSLRTRLSGALYPLGSMSVKGSFFREYSMFLRALLGAGMSYLLVRNFMKPVIELRKTTARLAEGDFSARVGNAVTERGDEISDLAESFNWMAERVEELVASHKRLLADISHEIRSPLQRMDVALTLAREAESDELLGYLQRAELEVGRIDMMVEELLTMARAESRMISFEEAVDMETLISDIVEDARFEGSREGKEIAAKLENLTVRGDTALLERAVSNVVHNAIRHTPGGTEVRIEMSEKEGEAEIQITDGGSGVPKEDLEKIFLPYYRTGKTGKSLSRGGTGLGLSISKSVVESHGGNIKAFNISEGGFAVKIRLPLYRA